MAQASVKVPPRRARKMTFEEFLEADLEFPAEWEDGEVIFLTVTAEHCSIHVFLLGLISGFVELQGLGETFSEPFVMKTGARLSGRAPDVCVLLNANMSRLMRSHIAGPADLVVEIVSPESKSRDWKRKYNEYEQGGVGEYWIIDPLKKTQAFYVLGEDGMFIEIMPDAEGVYRSAVLEGLWIKTEWFWNKPRPVASVLLKEWGLL